MLKDVPGHVGVPWSSSWPAWSSWNILTRSLIGIIGCTLFIVSSGHVDYVGIRFVRV